MHGEPVRLNKIFFFAEDCKLKKKNCSIVNFVEDFFFFFICNATQVGGQIQDRLIKIRINEIHIFGESSLGPLFRWQEKSKDGGKGEGTLVFNFPKWPKRDLGKQKTPN